MRSYTLLLLPPLHVNTTGRGVDRRHIQRCKGANCLHCTGFTRYVQRQSSCIIVKSVVPPTSLLSDSRVIVVSFNPSVLALQRPYGH
jgi:hypothetical protein